MIRTARWTALVLLICTLIASPLQSASAQDDAQAQLDATAAAMLALSSFHFKLETTAGKTVFQDALELKTVEGDLVRPANFKAEVAVKLAIVDLTLEVVSVDGNIWVKNPIGGDDSFIQVTGGDSEFPASADGAAEPGHPGAGSPEVSRRSADRGYRRARRPADDRADRHLRSVEAHRIGHAGSGRIDDQRRQPSRSTLPC